MCKAKNTHKNKQISACHRFELCSYTKEPILALGCVEAEIMCHYHMANLPLLVLEGTGPSLYGRN